MTDTAQARMEDAFHLGGGLVFTVRKDAPLRMTQAQARQKPHNLHQLCFRFKERHAAQWLLWSCQSTTRAYAVG